MVKNLKIDHLQISKKFTRLNLKVKELNEDELVFFKNHFIVNKSMIFSNKHTT